MVKRIAIAGGIGAGKSVVTEQLREYGHTVIDADDVAHEVTRRGSPTWRALRDAFGDAVLTTQGDLDRAFVAQIVFHDRSALRRLNHITHGAIGEAIIRRLDESSGELVFVALPLFRTEHRASMGLDEVWAVLADPEIAIRRVCELRGIPEQEARARVANQMTNEERLKIVDRVIWNNDTLADLRHGVDDALAALGVHHG